VKFHHYIIFIRLGINKHEMLNIDGYLRHYHRLASLPAIRRLLKEDLHHLHHLLEHLDQVYLVVAEKTRVGERIEDEERISVRIKL